MYAGWQALLRHLHQEGAILNVRMVQKPMWKVVQYEPFVLSQEWPCELPSHEQLQDKQKADREKSHPTSSVGVRAVVPKTLSTRDDFFLVRTVMNSSLDKLINNRAFGFALAYLMELRTGWGKGKNLGDFPKNPLDWTLKHLSHQGELAHIGVPRDPDNAMYFVMFASLLYKLGVYVTKEKVEAVSRCDVGHANEKTAFLSVAAKIPSKMNSRFVSFCLVRLLVRSASLRCDARLASTLFERAGDVFEAMLGLWNRCLPEAEALRKHICSRAGVSLKQMERDVKAATNQLGKLALQARRILEHTKGEGYMAARIFVEEHVNNTKPRSLFRAVCCVCDSSTDVQDAICDETVAVVATSVPPTSTVVSSSAPPSASGSHFLYQDTWGTSVVGDSPGSVETLAAPSASGPTRPTPHSSPATADPVSIWGGLPPPPPPGDLKLPPSVEYRSRDLSQPLSTKNNRLRRGREDDTEKLTAVTSSPAGSDPLWKNDKWQMTGWWSSWSTGVNTDAKRFKESGGTSSWCCIPTEIIHGDQRFDEVKASRRVYCDNCGKCCSGNNVGKFRISPQACVKDRWFEWSQGRWDATWWCVACHCQSWESESVCLDRLFGNRMRGKAVVCQDRLKRGESDQVRRRK